MQLYAAFCELGPNNTFHGLIKTNGEWKHIEKGATIGNKRLIRFETTLISALRFSIEDSKASPVISNIGVYKAPKLIK